MILGIQGDVAYGAVGSTRASWGTATNGIYSGAGPSLTAFGLVREVNLKIADGEADVTVRATGFWKLTAQALADAEIEIQALWKPTDPGWQAFLQAKFGRLSIPVAILDQAQAVSGASGLWADFAVMDLERPEPEDKEQVGKITLKPTLGPASLSPQWVQVP